MNLILIFYNSNPETLGHLTLRCLQVIFFFFFLLRQKRVGSGTHLKWLIRKGGDGPLWEILYLSIQEYSG